MRNIIIKDTSISKSTLFAVLEQYKNFWKKYTDIDVEFIVEQRDFSQVPTTTASDGDVKPTYAFRQMLVDDIAKRHGKYGTDNIVMLVHEDNFFYKGIWGQNWSYVHGPVSFQLCRWDKDKSANSFGTLYHEQMHPVDAVIKEELGFEIDRLFSAGFDWDKHVVHGGRPNDKGRWGYEYINYKQNTDALEMVAPYLKRAFIKRLIKHKEAQLAFHIRIRDLLRRIRAFRRN